MKFIVEMISAAVVMGVLDFAWLGYVAKKIYYQEIGDLLRKKPSMPAALLFYGIYVIGVTIFVTQPAVAAESWFMALGYGALFGLVAYATYDLTNFATLKGYSKKIVMIDLLWGMALTATVTLGSYMVVTFWF